MARFRFLGRQQRRFIIAILAALCSFTLGITMPMNHQATNAKLLNFVPLQEPPSFPQIFQVKGAIAQNIKVAKGNIEQLEQQRFSVTVPPRFQGTTVKAATLNHQEKVIALTFDDGPWPTTTEEILDILKTNEIKATFFMIGRHLKAFPEIGKKVVAAGHVIANHTWNHPIVASMSPERAQSEIEKTAELIEELTGLKTALFRPPGGVLTNGLADYIHQKKRTVVMWSADSSDWRSPPVNILTQNVLNAATSGGIVLLHDGGGDRSHTVQALPGIISELKKRGYKFVTVPELLAMQDREMVAQESSKSKPQT